MQTSTIAPISAGSSQTDGWPAQSLLEIRSRAHLALAARDPAEKVEAAQTLSSSAFRVPASVDCVPGRPEKPSLVSPRQLPHRSLATVSGRATLIHAVAHIEFNAINLALDIVARFPETSAEFVRDWIQVASEEAYHFRLVRAHLQTLGHDYGDFPAHDGLWEMAEKTKGSLLARLALVPRTLEARGLDVTPAMREKLAQAGDHAAASILDVILRDEIGHVAIGNKWFRHYCTKAGRAPLEAFAALATEFNAPRLRGPFNVAARQRAGFDAEELEWLQIQSER